MVKVSVVIAVYNAEHTILRCLESLFKNRFTHFEVATINDGSTDGTRSILDTITDPRLRVIHLSNRTGPANSRNVGIQVARGDYVFFTDADCVVCEEWISEGLKSLEEQDVVGVEGSLRYAVSDPSIRHRLPVRIFSFEKPKEFLSKPGSEYCTGNIAYKRQFLLDRGGFNSSRYSEGREDSDLGWRLRGMGNILYNEKMSVTHAAYLWTWKSLMCNARRYEKDVLFFKDHGFFFYKKGPFIHPHYLLMLLFPPFMLSKITFKSFKDILFVPQLYLYLIKVRIHLWKRSFQEGAWVF